MKFARSSAMAAALAVSFAWAGAAPVAAGSLIDVQFAGNFSVRCGNGTNSCSNAQQVGAAYIGTAGDTWNYFNNATGNRSLIDVAGAVSGVSINYSSDGTYTDGTGVNNLSGTPYQNLMGGYILSSAQNGIVITLSGLGASRAFDLYAYSEQDLRGVANRAMDVSVNGTTKRDRQSGAGSFIEGQTFLHFAGTADALGSVNISISTVATYNAESDLNGLQLSLGAVPEPSTWAMLLVGFGSLGAALRARRRANAKAA